MSAYRGNYYLGFCSVNSLLFMDTVYKFCYLLTYLLT